MTRDHRRVVHPESIHSRRPAHTNRMRRKQGWLPQERYRPCLPYPGSRAAGFREEARSAPRSPDRAVPTDLAPRVLPHRVRFPVNITTRRAFPEKRPRLVDNDLPPRLPAAGAGAFLTTPVRFAFDQRFTPREFLTRFPGRDRPRGIKEGDGVPPGPELGFRLRLRTAPEGGAHVHDHRLARARRLLRDGRGAHGGVRSPIGARFPTRPPPRRLRIFYHPYSLPADGKGRVRPPTGGSRRIRVTAGPTGGGGRRRGRRGRSAGTGGARRCSARAGSPSPSRSAAAAARSPASRTAARSPGSG